jgi:hypothetical protein
LVMTSRVWKSRSRQEASRQQKKKKSRIAHLLDVLGVADLSLVEERLLGLAVALLKLLLDEPRSFRGREVLGERLKANLGVLALELLKSFHPLGPLLPGADRLLGLGTGDSDDAANTLGDTIRLSDGEGADVRSLVDVAGEEGREKKTPSVRKSCKKERNRHVKLTFHRRTRSRCPPTSCW